MKKVYVTGFGLSAAFATMDALIMECKKGKDYVSTLDYPFLNNTLFDDNYRCNPLIKRVESIKELTGYTVQLDAKGNEISREENYRPGRKFYFDREDILRLEEGLHSPFNQQALDYNCKLARRQLERLNNLA